ncbi:proline-rich protein precursor [Solanum lycopersicum]|uniref:proline-rich protein precursor n=1 Tax=Solanum lycopersicum TaxID=4081 RepID=UPI0002BC9C62|nr:proline-rich protein precursor [Solanum lycopersicum]
MEFSKITSLLFISMLFLSSFTPILGCGYCGKPSHKPKKPKVPTPIVKPPVDLPPIGIPPIVKPPVNLPPIGIPPIVKPPVKLPPIGIPPIVKPPVILPPVGIPPIVKPPVKLPPVGIPPIVKPPVDLPPVGIPPVTVPPIVKPPVDLPPIGIPPVTVPPVIKPSPKGKKPCPPTTKATCPIDTLKLGACVDLLGGLVHIGLGDPAVNECCPILSGLVELEAAACLCTTLKVKLLNLKIYVPLALQLLVTCGKSPPPGYTCSI